MKHFGDITKLNGAELPFVDVITGGSPCQDLSIAGQRKGLAGERSGLFMEQIRVVKEMRDESKRRLQSRGTTFNIRCLQPRYMVWENVPGVLSSNKGEDFRKVLEETAKIADKTAVIPRPPKGKWTNSGCIMGDGWSIAWRVHDAQFWGVPQRRRRIALVADFGGQSAPEILFERKGLSGDSEPGRTEREETAGAVGNGIKKASGCLNGWDCQSKRIFAENGIIQTLNSGTTEGMNIVPSVLCLNDQGGQQMSVSDNQTGTLRAEEHGHQLIVCGINGEVAGTLDSSYYKGCGERQGIEREVVFCLQGNGIDRAETAGCNGKGWRENESYTLNTIDRHAVYDARGNGDGNICPTITGDHENRIKDYTAITTYAIQRNDQYKKSDKSHTCSARDYKSATDLVVSAVYCRNGTENHDINGKLQAKSTGGMSVNLQNVCRQGTVVRRLTPLECERLQGYPDGWTDIGEWVDGKGKKHKEADSPRYKALGNSIALPFWQWMAERIVMQLKNNGVENPTMGSLFDGISGFPLVFARAGTRPLWTSEIEEFPIAVCKVHFGDEDADIEGDIEKYL